jgi:dCTP deaminase
VILVDSQIRQAVQDKVLSISDFDDDYVQPASYDLRIGPRIYEAPHPESPHDLSANGGGYRLPPYGMVVVESLENLVMAPQLAGRLGLKTDFTRRGMFASIGPQVDPGFRGKLFVSLFNMTATSHILQYREPFLTIEFHELAVRPDKIYDGSYQDKVSVTPEIMEAMVRLEGLTLNEIQREFTSLTQHLEVWQAMASRFTEFLEKMDRQTESINRLATLSEGTPHVESGPAPTDLRDVSVEEAEQEILSLFGKAHDLTYSDIVDTLHLDLATVIAACEDLVERGVIERPL